MIKKLNEISLEFEKRLINNNIRGYALTIDVENLNNTMRTNAMFSQGEQNTGVMSFQLRLNELPVSLLEGTTVYANIVNKDAQLYHPCEIIDNELGIVLIRFKSQAIKTNGTHTLELVIQYSENEKLICPKVQYEVFASLDINISEPAEDELSLIQDLISNVKNLNSEVTNKELVRESNENSRIETELLRVDSEDKRAEHELSRVASEEIRIETEKTRINDETIRKSSESTRVESEITRIESEENRETNETTRANSEKLRTQEELTRKNNESSRIEAEVARAEAHIEFINTEATRQENETLRVSAEEDRKNKESARNTAEIKRVDVEKTRVNNESTRINSEILRKSAEVNRVDSENSRVEAEKVREIRFEEMAGSSQLSEITNEIKAARSDYFGKEHASLKAKEDSEFEFVHIDNSKGMFMPLSSNTESIKIENSIEGKTRDLCIKGKTMQNLYSTTSYDKNKEYEFNVRYGGISIRPTAGGNFNEKYYGYVSITKLTEGTLDETMDDLGFVQTFLGTGGYASHLMKVSEWRKVKIGETIVLKFNRTMDVNDPTRFIVTLMIGIGGENPNKLSTGKFKINECMLLKDVEPTIYFENIKSLGEEENRINILSTGKNLVNIPDSEWNISSVVGTLVAADRVISKNIEIHLNQKARVSCITNSTSGNITVLQHNTPLPDNIISHNSAYTFITSNGGVQSTITINPGYKYLTFTTGGSISPGTLKPGDKMYFKNVMVEEGITPTLYEPYRSDKNDILLPITGGAKCLPNGVCDEQYANGDYLQKIKKIDLSKITNSAVSLSWGETDVLIGFSIQTDDIVGIKTYNSTAMSNLFPYTAYEVLTTKNYEWFSYNSISKVLCIKILKRKLKTADINGLVDYLNSTPMCIYGELEEHMLHKATTPTNNNISTFKDVTHISCTNKIAPSNIAAKFPINLPQKLVSLDKENQNLKTDLNTLKNNYTSLITELNMFKTQVLPYLNGEVTGE